MARPAVLVVAIVAVLCGAVAAGPEARPQLADIGVTSLLNRANDALAALRQDEALRLADEALVLAEKLKDRVGVAMAHRMRGQALRQLNRPLESEAAYQRALADFEGLGNQAGVADVLSGLIVNASQAGNTVRVRELGDRALLLYQRVDNERAKAKLLRILIASGAYNQFRERWTEEILETGNRLRDDELIADALILRANRQFSAAQYAEARLAYEQGIAALERTGRIETLAAAYLSLGRVFRAHGDYPAALARYQKAIDLLQPTRERYTMVEATNAKAIALGLLNRTKESIAAYEHGLALARETGNQRLIDFMEGNLAGGYLRAGDYERAIVALQTVIARKPERSLLGYRLGQLSTALTYVGRENEALEPSSAAVEIARELTQTDELVARLDTRAWILARLHRYEEALVFSGEARALVEQIRTQLVPSDFLKRGYAEKAHNGDAMAVLLLSELGRGAEALEVAEKGRARAFLDLMASREATSSNAAGSRTTAAELASGTLGQPLDAAGIQAIATRLNTTLVSYWVNDETTVIWVTRPGSSPAMTKVQVRRQRIQSLVAATTAALRPAATAAATRGETADVPTEASEDLVALPMRGLGLAALSKDDKAAWRQLHRLLIEPVRAQLPARGSRLTIVPHGPLFQLSFAALNNAQGRYLIEDYELHYAPAASVLAFTGRRQGTVAENLGAPWAIVGNPAALPRVGQRALAPLPGAGREIAAIAAIAPGGRVLRLDGATAHESAVFEALHTRPPAVLHFATHGFVFDDATLAPFLALHQRDETEAGDGRLTLDEVYRLRLRTDLVVLSACRTGAGQVSSDGIVGLTRGFFYAGTPTVIATFWDITDETTASLMPGFYRRYASTYAKSKSLRAAQLALLADLRAGKITVTAGGRKVILPEHPLLWAAFFLSGEP